jgi:hypothetical protein
MTRSIPDKERQKLSAEIALLESLDVAQLRARWKILYETEAPTRFSRDLLMRAVAYRMQERVLGGVKPATRRLFERVSQDARARRPIRVAPVRQLAPGALLIREWGGTKHQVTVLESGVMFRGHPHRAAIAGAIEEFNIDASRLPSIFRAAEAWIQSLRLEAEAAPALAQLIERLGLKQDGIQVSIKLPIPASDERDPATPNELGLTRFVPMRMKRRGVEMRLILDGDAGPAARVDLPLLKATARAYRWSDDLVSGQVRSIGEIAKREHLTGRYVRRVMRLAFLAPRIVEAIAERRQPADLTTHEMTQRIDLPPLWSAQEQALGLR